MKRKLIASWYYRAPLSFCNVKLRFWRVVLVFWQSNWEKYSICWCQNDCAYLIGLFSYWIFLRKALRVISLKIKRDLIRTCSWWHLHDFVNLWRDPISLRCCSEPFWIRYCEKSSSTQWKHGCSSTDWI